MDSPACQLDEEKDVQGLQANRFNREEVAGQDSVSLGSKELRPGRPVPSMGWADPVCSKNPAVGGGVNLDPELLQLTLNADVTPARVLAGKANNERHRFGSDWRPS